jgi:hypothetical protein
MDAHNAFALSIGFLNLPVHPRPLVRVLTDEYDYAPRPRNFPSEKSPYRLVAHLTAVEAALIGRL